MSGGTKNIGERIGDEVVQLYRRPVDPQRPRALKELRGIERITLKPGESRPVTFSVKPDRDLTIYYDVKKSCAVDPGKFEVQIGASSGDIRAKGSLAVQ
jgi:beta-glucosidase